jgi:hypothetical protein
LNLSAIKSRRVVEPDRTKPFSWLVTGVVLRAFAAHPTHRKSPEARVAGRLLLARFFKPDSYPDRKGAKFWTEFRFPFWFTDLVSALDSLSRLGFTIDDPQMRKGVDWLIARRRKDGTWHLRMMASKNVSGDEWMTKSILRIFARLHVSAEPS